ncbi:MAG: PadR family transcriptional regulator [Planctomycetota bacterium]|jgi:DNA-binding PadR family transcriptional regulator
MKKLRKQTLDGNVETLLLAILQAGPSYGYAIVKELNKRADGILNLGEGTVYPVLHRLEEKKLICSNWQLANNGRQRKYYRLTPKGKKAFNTNRMQWLMLSNVMEKVLGPHGKIVPIPLLKGISS